MGLFTFNITYHSDDKVLSEINTKIDKIMANVQELTDLVEGLKTTVADLQASTDALQEKVTNAVASLETTIADLTNQLANGATPEQVQVFVDTLTQLKTDLEATKTDLDSTEV